MTWTRAELRAKRKKGIERVDKFIRMYKVFSNHKNNVFYFRKFYPHNVHAQATEEEELLFTLLFVFNPREKGFYRLIRNDDVYNKLTEWYEKRGS